MTGSVIFGLGRVHPREVLIGHAGGQEVGGAVRHVNEVGRVAGDRKGP